MASEIRANKQTNRVGLGTVTYTDTGIIVSGIVTANSISGGSSVTATTFYGSGYNKDIFSNGFKPRSGNGGHNDNAETYLFMAFAEQPEVTPFGSQSNAR